MDVNCHSVKSAEAEQPSGQAHVGHKRCAEGPVSEVNCSAKRSAGGDNVVSDNVEPCEVAGTTKEVLSGPVQGYSPMDEAASRAWVDRKCAEDEERWGEVYSAWEMASKRKYYEEQLAAVERYFFAEIHANTDADGKASVVCDFCEEIHGFPPNERIKELVLQSHQTGLETEYLDDLRLLFPKMRVLTIELEDVWFSHKSDRKLRWTGDINELCDILENFLRTDDAMEQIRLVVLDKPGVAVRRFKGSHREADKFVKKVRFGTKTFSASIQASAQNIFGRRFY